MSYNIDSWKTKKLENLIIPKSAFFKHTRADWHPEIKLNPDTYEVTLSGGCEQEIKGVLKDGQIFVKEFDMSGEGSGTFYDWILVPALEESTGILEAVLIWEGGDSISGLRVIGGNVQTWDIEL